MAVLRVLILSRFYPADIDSGEYLRVGNLCRQLGRHHECYLAYVGEPVDDVACNRELGVNECLALPVIPANGRSLLRHFRISDARFLRQSVPDYLDAAQSSVRGLCDKWDIEAIVCLAPNIAEFVETIDLPKVLDFCDCQTLAVKRMLKNRKSSFSLLERSKLHLSFVRSRRKERALLRQFDHTTTISDPDRCCLLEGAGVADSKVSVIANGVADRALKFRGVAAERKRSVVFWGNLDFPPNWTALTYFYEKVYLPFLADEDIEFHVIGRGADPDIEKMLVSPGVHMHGYVEKLYEEIGRHGVMINPMVEGGGLKNKVLEAFACHIPVVSTGLGMGSINAKNEQHFLEANAAPEFAAAVVRLLADHDLADDMRVSARQLVEREFNWDGIGDLFSTLVERVAAAPLVEEEST